MRRMQRERGTLQPLAPILAQTLRQVGLGRVALLGRIVQHWEDIVGPQLAAVTQPESVRSQVLFVTVTEAIWLQQLMFYHSQLLQNIRKILGNVRITRLHFVLAASSSPSVPDEAEKVPESLPLTPTEEQQILEDTSGIADLELRRLVRCAWRQGLQAGRWSP